MEVLYEGGVATAMQPGVWGHDIPPPPKKAQGGKVGNKFSALDVRRRQEGETVQLPAPRQVEKKR